MELKNGMKGSISGFCGLALACAVTPIFCGRLEGFGAWRKAAHCVLPGGFTGWLCMDRA